MYNFTRRLGEMYAHFARSAARVDRWRIDGGDGRRGVLDRGWGEVREGRGALGFFLQIT